MTGHVQCGGHNIVDIEWQLPRAAAQNESPASITTRGLQWHTDIRTYGLKSGRVQRTIRGCFHQPVTGLNSINQTSSASALFDYPNLETFLVEKICGGQSRKPRSKDC